MTGSIICGVDDSESASGAARVARSLSAQLGAELVFVRVVDDDLPTGEAAALAARLQRLAASATEVDSGARWLVVAGHPADRLVAVAEEEAARLIVVGSTGPRSSLLGSISADVSRRAPCPVVVVAPSAAGRRARGHEPMTGDAASAGGISGARDFAGGIVRFGLGAGGAS